MVTEFSSGRTINITFLKHYLSNVTMLNSLKFPIRNTVFTPTHVIKQFLKRTLSSSPDSNIADSPDAMYTPGPWFNIHMSYCQYIKSHYGERTILRPSNLHNVISYTSKMSYLYWIGAQIASTPMCSWPSHHLRVCIQMFGTCYEVLTCNISSCSH